MIVQYIQNCVLTFRSYAFHSKTGIANIVATVVLGKKIIVTAASVFIEVESCFTARPRVLESLARDIETFESFCVMR